MTQKLMAIICLFAFSNSYAASKVKTVDVIRIEVGREDFVREDKVSRKDLYRRIYLLEKAVRQLQDRVFDLELSHKISDEDEKSFTCYIKTPFDGTFTATKKSLTEAKASAIKQCSTKLPTGFSCDDNKVVCGE